MRLKKKEFEELIEKGHYKNLSHIEDEELGMDSHGAIKTLAIVTNGEDNYGFYYEKTSEEMFFEDQNLFKVRPEEELRIVWYREDKKSHWN